MNCPISSAVDLVITEKQGIEIDYCPTCRGVWLDRGELDKIIQRTQQSNTNSVRIPSVSSQKDEHYEIIYEGPRDVSDDNRHFIKRKKPERVLREIFEFLD